MSNQRKHNGLNGETHMKRVILITLAAVWTVMQVSASEWLTDLPKALDKAKADKKMVFMDFTGSDWCPPCQALHKTVLTSAEFEKFAKDNLILVEVDFPQGTEQTEELKASNKELAKKYEVEGFPTVIVLNAQGKQLTKKMGYTGESAGDFVAELEKLKKTEKTD